MNIQFGPASGRIGTSMKYWLTCLAVLALAACAPPPELTTQNLRPGISSGAEYDRARLRGGLSAKYAYVLPKDAPLTMTMAFRTSNGKNGTINYNGEFSMNIPNGETERVAAALLPKDIDLPFDVRGDSIVFPGSGILDRKGRHLESRTRLSTAIYIPHDCWAVIGLCKSSARGPSGEEVHVVIETSELGGFWRSTTRLDPEKMRGSKKLITQSVYTLDRNLLPIDIKSVDYTERPYATVLIRRAR